MSAAQPLDDLHRYISPIEEVVEEARQGRMFILVDAEDRENEGDLVIPAQFATPDKVNFMARFGRGLICLAMTAERTRALGLEPMAPRNETRHKTAFTVSIEAREGISTGISAHDRAHTIAVAIDPTKSAADITTPGHVFPLEARPGGVLVRAGHTEASVDIARLAGLLPSAVICEIMKDDGAMARLPDLIGFAQFHNLKIGTIADLIGYRRQHDHMIEKLGERPFKSRFGDAFRIVIFKNTLDGAEYPALVKGDIAPDRPALVRVHRLDFGADVLAGAGPRGQLIDHAMAEIAREEGAGVIVIIWDRQTSALSSRFLGAQPADIADPSLMLREYGVGAQILRELGVRQMVLLSDSPHTLVGLDGYGLTIAGWRGFQHDQGTPSS
ncbi:MAG: 3,4-dihydroxy-2-butanone-4-phosphate synthase [Alphaproteobacteria bacterium]|nr:3,4-dihydroxy-2-butanone-4-phosphate synthase [Alphaproteobacteria bacterium]